LFVIEVLLRSRFGVTERNESYIICWSKYGKRSRTTRTVRRQRL